MAVNKVVFGAVAIMDISDSTVTPETLKEGETAYQANGEKITGTMKSGGGGFPNGTEWTYSNITDCDVRGFAFANGIWIACGEILRYSNDGKTWLPCTATAMSSYGTFQDFHSAGYAKGLWVATSRDACLWYSENGIEWTPAQGTDDEMFYQLAFGNGMWVAAGYEGAWTSTDGITWTYSFDIGDGIDALIFANSMFVLGIKGTMYYSQDGLTWSSYDFPRSTTTVSCAEYGSGVFVVTTQRGIFYSEDGMTWTASNITKQLNYVCHANGKWVAVGTGTYISDDGKTWIFNDDADITGVLYTVANANGIWVGSGGTLGSLSYSADGAQWTQSNISGVDVRHMHNANGLWVAGGVMIVYSVGWELS